MFNRKLKKYFFFLCMIGFVFVGCLRVPPGNFKDVVSECKGKTQQDMVICRGLGWVFQHPVDMQADGFLELGEEINLFYRFYLKAKNKAEKRFFRSVVESKIDYLLNEHDLKVDFAGEITAYLNFAKIMKRMDIERPEYQDFIQKEILTNPMTYPPAITYAILNSALIEDIGSKSRVPFGNLISQGVIARFSQNPELVPIGKAYASPDDVMNFYYDITHEIFAVSNFGDRDPTQFLLDNEIEYLKDLIPRGIETYIAEGQVDILGELIICAKLLKYTDFDNFKKGVQYILDAQKEDGSFGLIQRMVFLGRPNVYRHGVLVSVWALIE
ncbi:MAG: DUF6895 family protein [bacterium]